MAVAGCRVQGDQPRRGSLVASQAEFAGQGGEAAVVPAALSGGVLDVADVGQGVGGLVQQGGEHLGGGAAQSFAGDEHFGQAGVAVLPAKRGEVPVLEFGRLGGGGAGGDDDDRGRQLRVAGADGGPGRFQRADECGGGEGVVLTRTCHAWGARPVAGAGGRRRWGWCSGSVHDARSFQEDGGGGCVTGSLLRGWTGPQPCCGSRGLRGGVGGRGCAVQVGASLGLGGAADVAGVGGQAQNVGVGQVGDLDPAGVGVFGDEPADALVGG